MRDGYEEAHKAVEKEVISNQSGRSNQLATWTAWAKLAEAKGARGEVGMEARGPRGQRS